MYITLSCVGFFSLIGLFFFRKMAKAIGLVDVPNQRKKHHSSIPLVGGLSIFFTIMLYSITQDNSINGIYTYLTCTSILVVVGGVDDKYDINPYFRLAIQAVVAIILIISTDLYLHDLGHIFSESRTTLNNTTSYVITIFAVIGAINAFNMVDGIDGLLGGLAIVTFSALAYLFYASAQKELMMFCFVFIAATLPYVALNLGFPFGRRFKIFMGDAGSVFIGFTVIWLLLNGSQLEGSSAVHPVTALWIIALPLMDMVTIMVRRIKKGKSPLKPDRQHLHHICQRFGFSSNMTLILICTKATIMAYIGIWAQTNNISEHLMFTAFLLIFCAYYLTLAYIWRISAFTRRYIQKITTKKSSSIAKNWLDK